MPTTFDAEPVLEAGFLGSSGAAGGASNSRIVAASGNPLIDGLLSGVAWNQQNLTFAFPTSSAQYLNGTLGGRTGFFGFNTDQALVANFARSLISDYTLLTFNAGTATNANLRYANFGGSQIVGFYPDGFSGMGDVWYGTQNNDQGVGTIGTLAYATIMHEQGHTLGLKHGQDTGINGGVARDVNGAVIPNYAPLPSANDSWNQTLMTYRSYVGATDSPIQGFTGSDNPVTYMMADIAALQYLYGANFSGTSSNNTFYQWDANGNKFVNGTLFLPAAVGGKIFETIWDGGGIDTIDTSNFSTSQRIDLRPGQFSTIDRTKLADLDRINPGTKLADGNFATALLFQGNLRSLIENATTGNGSDLILGNQAANVLVGLGGGDTLVGDGPVSLTSGAQSIRRLYLATLDRAPDDAGWQDWASRRNAGQDLNDIAAGFVNSSEFQTKYGPLNNSQFVTQLYRNVLDREPDAGGLAAYTGALNAGTLTRTQVVTTFSESRELTDGSSNTIIAGETFRLYGATLARAPDSAGFGTWTDALGNGRGLVEIAAGFVNSSEFQTKYGNQSNTGFVTLLYQNVLGRAPDSGGLAFWTGQLDGNVQSRTQVVTGFSESAEYINATRAAADGFVRNVMTAWSDTLIGGAGDDRLTGGRGSDRFIFAANEPGNDTVYGFDAFDTLQLAGFGFATSAQALAAITQQGANAVLTFNGGSITFDNTQLSVLQSLSAQGWVLS